MKAAMAYGPADIRWEEVDTPEPKAGEVRVRVSACGVCGSDIPRILNGTAHYYPIVLGHEFAGTVDAIGAEVEGFCPGNRVAVIPLIPCMECAACRKGQYSLCSKYSFVGSRRSGGYAEYAVLPAENLLRLQESTDLMNAALLEPATVALHGIRKSGFSRNHTACVVGGGIVGTFCTQWLRIEGASEITVIGRNQNRLDLNQRLGADAVFTSLAEDYIKKALAAAEISGSSEDGGYEYVFECGGTPETVRIALQMAAPQGTVCLFGTINNEITFTKAEWEQILRKELKLCGSWMSGGRPYPGEDWVRTVECYENGSLQVDPKMISLKLPLSEAERLPAILQDKEYRRGRIILDCRK